MRVHGWQPLVGLSLCISGWACGSSQTPAVQPAQPSQSAKEEVSAAQDGNQKLVDAFAYVAANRRDPFRSYLVEVSERRNTEQQGRKLEETEHFEITDYRLTGLMTGISQPKAMLEDPSGRGHVVHIGARVGKNGGRVTSIAPHGIQVTEDAVDPLGRHQRNIIDVPLPASAVDTESAP